MYGIKKSFRYVNLSLRLIASLVKYWLWQCVYEFGKFS